MEKTVLTFTKNKDTKNTVRYAEEVADGETPKVAMIYIHKSALGTPVPESLTVTVEGK